MAVLRLVTKLSACLPAKRTIRGLQNHHHKLQKIDPGYRAAINIVNLNYQDIQRGDVIAHPGDYQSSQLLDAHFRLLKDSPFPIKHNMEVKLFIAASETTAKLRLLGEQILNRVKTPLFSSGQIPQSLPAKAIALSCVSHRPQRLWVGGLSSTRTPTKFISVSKKIIFSVWIISLPEMKKNCSARF